MSVSNKEAIAVHPGAKQSGSDSPGRPRSGSTGSTHGAGGGGNKIVIPVNHFFNKNDGIFGAETGARWTMAEPTDVEHSQGFIAAKASIQAGYELEVQHSTGTTKVLTDTGSAAIAISIPGELAFHDASHEFGIKYGDGTQYRGKFHTEDIKLGQHHIVTILQQIIGKGKLYKPVGKDWEGSTRGGIFGLGPENGSEGTVRHLSKGNKRRILDKAFEGPNRTLIHSIRTKLNLDAIISLHYFPYGHHADSRLVLGGYENSLIVTQPVYTHMVFPSTDGKHNAETRGHWALKQKLKMGTEVLTTANAIVDSGATQFFLPEAVYEKYIQKTGAVHNAECDGYILTEEQFKNLPSLTITITDEHNTDHDFEYKPDAQIWSKALSDQEKVPKNHYVLSFARCAKDENLVIFGLPVGTLMRAYSYCLVPCN